MPHRQRRGLPWQPDPQAPDIDNFGDNVFAALPPRLWDEIGPCLTEDADLRRHCSRLGALSFFLAKCAGRWDSGWLNRLAEAAVLHDIGKTRLDQTILGKGRDVSGPDIDHIRTHALRGAELLSTYGGDSYALAATVAGNHHEAYDGSGYPYGLIGDSVPEEARIVALCDVYDALRSPRSYKPALGHDHTMRIMLGGDNRTRRQQFDPFLLGVFERHSHEITQLYQPS